MVVITGCRGGGFTSLFYLGDEEHKDTKTVSYALRDLIVDNMAKTPGVLALNKSMNDRYARFQRFDVYGTSSQSIKARGFIWRLKGNTRPANPMRSTALCCGIRIFNVR